MRRRQVGSDERDEQLARVLRRIYRIPADRAYWDALEARLVTRIFGPGGARLQATAGWWHLLAGWARPLLLVGVMAATVIAGGLLQAMRWDEREAIRELIDTPRSLSQRIATRTTGLEPREAVLRYLVAP